MKKSLLTLFVSSLALIAVSGISGSSAQSKFPTTIKHDVGETVIAAVPKRVVVLSEELMELMIPLGVKPVGYGSGRMQSAKVGEVVTGLSYYSPEQIGNATFVGSTFEPSFEAILALKPDLILVWASASVATIEALKKIAPTIGWDFNRDEKTGWRKAFTAMSRVFDLEPQAETYLKKYDAQLRVLRARISPIVARSPRVTSLFLFNEANTGVFGPKFGFSLALIKMGFRLMPIPGVAIENGSYQQITPEAIVNIKSDMVIYLRQKANNGVYPELLAERLLRQTKVPTYRFLLDVQEPQSGPITDLRRIEGIVKLLLEK